MLKKFLKTMLTTCTIVSVISMPTFANETIDKPVISFTDSAEISEQIDAYLTRKGEEQLERFQDTVGENIVADIGDMRYFFKTANISLNTEKTNQLPVTALTRVKSVANGQVETSTTESKVYSMKYTSITESQSNEFSGGIDIPVISKIFSLNASGSNKNFSSKTEFDSEQNIQVDTNTEKYEVPTSVNGDSFSTCNAADFYEITFYNTYDVSGKALCYNTKTQTTDPKLGIVSAEIVCPSYIFSTDTSYYNGFDYHDYGSVTASQLMGWDEYNSIPGTWVGYTCDYCDKELFFNPSAYMKPFDPYFNYINGNMPPIDMELLHVEYADGHIEHLAFPTDGGELIDFYNVSPEDFTDAESLINSEVGLNHLTSNKWYVEDASWNYQNIEFQHCVGQTIEIPIAWEINKGMDFSKIYSISGRDNIELVLPGSFQQVTYGKYKYMGVVRESKIVDKFSAGTILDENQIKSLPRGKTVSTSNTIIKEVTHEEKNVSADTSSFGASLGLSIGETVAVEECGKIAEKFVEIIGLDLGYKHTNTTESINGDKKVWTTQEKLENKYKVPLSYENAGFSGMSLMEAKDIIKYHVVLDVYEINGSKVSNNKITMEFDILQEWPRLYSKPY